MKVYGYEKSNEDFVELREASIECTMDELDRIIKFLQNTKEQHNKAKGKTEICHSHYRDWDKEWSKEQSDIIIFTTFYD